MSDTSDPVIRGSSRTAGAGDPRPRFAAGPQLEIVPVAMPTAVRRHATARPTSVAVVAPDATLTWSELHAAADRIAAALVAEGLNEGDRIAFTARLSAWTVALLVGAGRAGIASVPLGPRLTGSEINAALAETTPSLIVMGRRPETDPGFPISTLDELLASGEGDSPTRSLVLSAEHDAVCVLTSGTTGRAKAAALSHGALAESAAAWTAALPPATGWLLCLGLHHVAGLGVVWRALTAGVPLVMTKGFEPGAVLSALSAPDAPSHISLVPNQLARLLDLFAEAPDATPAPPTLRAVPVGGGFVPPALIARALAAGWPVVPTYGLTEASSGVTALPSADAAAAPDTAGPPLPGVTVRIARPGPDGVGEIEVSSAALFSGYFGRPEESLAAFTDDAYLRTGDLGSLDSAGRLVVADRRDDLVISGGENVYPAEVEAVLASHPAIVEAGVVGLPDPRWGAVPAAAIALRPDVPDPGDEALLSFARARLAAYKVPAALARVDRLPRGDSGKLRRAELRAALQAQATHAHAHHHHHDDE